MKLKGDSKKRQTYTPVGFNLQDNDIEYLREKDIKHEESYLRIVDLSKGKISTEEVDQQDSTHSRVNFKRSIFCINHKSRNSVNYPNLQSAQRPIPHSDNLPVPQRPVNMDDVTEESVSESSDSDPTFEPSTSNKEPHFITQNDLNDLVRDLDLSKRQAELLASRLHDWNLLEKYQNIRIQISTYALLKFFFSRWQYSVLQ
ncbi:hypothetical protein EVAR_33151_1 [Eumeta japonica]|uniref:Uncharacterized protein n=1 Tax=Eumeta variegata TaxID=151549 RepID=A0A4C1ZS63_EUMVA|nr:hypothetical protein EVAR_33151_1 [Eumeta japonica]